MPNTSTVEFIASADNWTEYCQVWPIASSCPVPSKEEQHTIRALCENTQTMVNTVFSLALATGLPGSVLVLVVFSRMTIRPNSLYMCTLAVSDFLYLSITSVGIYRDTAQGTRDKRLHKLA
ncbi:hypothetical protein ElyMa_005740200 [Elysia marginata]|uniref:G-protein coupled receptors family 1 profile domain-containing protein n=1 Tax=Elysia marginata TaxID=1093978 RepID=A0AAV4FKR3_9GAST|nr:hypothetical protein ElyMa_005740200 [Elysia marginata]